MEMITLNDGTELQDSHALSSGGTLYFYLKHVTFAEAYEMLSDPDKTAHIVCSIHGDETAYDGYTDLYSLKREADGTITGGLMAAD